MYLGDDSAIVLLHSPYRGLKCGSRGVCNLSLKSLYAHPSSSNINVATVLIYPAELHVDDEVN